MAHVLRRSMIKNKDIYPDVEKYTRWDQKATRLNFKTFFRGGCWIHSLRGSLAKDCLELYTKQYDCEAPALKFWGM